MLGQTSPARTRCLPSCSASSSSETSSGQPVREHSSYWHPPLYLTGCMYCYHPNRAKLSCKFICIVVDICTAVFATILCTATWSDMQLIASSTQMTRKGHCLRWIIFFTLWLCCPCCRTKTHLTLNQVNQGDAVFMTGQHRALGRTPSQPGTTKYFLPGDNDKVYLLPCQIR